MVKVDCMLQGGRYGSGGFPPRTGGSLHAQQTITLCLPPQFLGHTSRVPNSDIWQGVLQGHQQAISGLVSIEGPILEAAEAISSCLQSGKKVLFCGNGGSAADAQHLAAELVGRFQKERKAMPALALHTDTSALTSIANDYGFDNVYARQVQAHGRDGDVLVALSTSGNSVSIIRAAEEASHVGMKIIAMTGHDGGQLKTLCDIWIGVPSSVTARIQECHILIGHFLCEVAEASAP